MERQADFILRTMGNRLYDLAYLEKYVIEIIFEFYLSSNNCKELNIK